MQQKKHYQVLVVTQVAGIVITRTSSTLVTLGSYVAATATMVLAQACSTSAATMVVRTVTPARVLFLFHSLFDSM